VSGDGRAVDLSVVLVNWNAGLLTAAALASLREHTRGVAWEVIVVDNGSRDGSVAALRRGFPWVSVIANPDNRGFSRATNQALRLARGRHVLLLNTDTVQVGNALGEAVRYMDAHPDVGMLGIRHLNADAARSVQPSCFAFPEPWRDILGALGLARARPSEGGPGPAERDVDWVCGSFLLARRACLDAVGPLDERFFVYDEDIDWCRRAWVAGWRVRFWPGAAVVHAGAAARAYMRDKTFVHLRSRLSYIAKHHSRLAGLLYYAALSGRLAGATAAQALRFALGRADGPDVTGRWRRQLRFLLLGPARRGC
jgi:GT2 family glycosyltransferase